MGKTCFSGGSDGNAAEFARSITGRLTRAKLLHLTRDKRLSKLAPLYSSRTFLFWIQDEAASLTP